MIKSIANDQEQREHINKDGRHNAPTSFIWGEKLARNMALAVLLLLTVVSVRNAELPTGETVLTAVQEMIDSDWDEHLGKIDFVSNMFPETVSVFFDTAPAPSLSAPCFGQVSHAWTQDEPFIGYKADDGRVYAAGNGQIMSLAYGPMEERIVRIRHENGVETLYYGLDQVCVQEGDPVTDKTCLGTVKAGLDAAVEVRRAGVPVDPTALLAPRSVDQP